jgi:hypothetical protein
MAEMEEKKKEPERNSSNLSKPRRQSILMNTPGTSLLRKSISMKVREKMIVFSNILGLFKPF